MGSRRMEGAVVTLPYDIDALHARADRALCCTRHRHAVAVDAEELVAPLAEFRRMQRVVYAAISTPGEIRAAVAVYWEQRRDAGAGGGAGP
jgi:hypothetical protein